MLLLTVSSILDAGKVVVTLQQERRIVASESPGTYHCVESERTVLVGVYINTPVNPKDPLLELSGLAITAGAHVVAELVQRRHEPDQRTYIGRGKLKELFSIVEHHDADVVMFDNDLSPAQIRNLEHELDCKVLDRSEGHP